MSSAHRILVADDQDSMRQLLCSALRALGYTEVVTAGDGRQALKILRGRMIDVVLLDVEMPVLDGFETLTEMRADPNLAAIPVIMVTSRADVAFVRQIMPLQLAGYLVKPATGAALQTCLTRAFAKRPPPAGPDEHAA